MKFQLNEYAILNEKIERDLPTHSGDLVTVTRIITSSPNFQYDVELPNGDYAPVRESELNKLTDEQKELITYIKFGYHARYTPTEELVLILKTDYLHGVAEVEFEDAGIQVVDMCTLKKIEKEIDSVEENHNKSRSERHREIIEEIHNTFIIKNADYGNSFGEQYEEYGLLSALIRLDDKMRRLKQLNKQTAQVRDESIRDTVLDLANYAIMTVMELDKSI